MPTLIYAMCCPETGVVRYVGKTSQDLNSRLAKHLDAAKYESSRVYHNPLQCWIRKVVRGGMLPEMKLLLDVGDGDWASWERRLIDWFRSLSPRILNVSDGGEGNPRPKNQKVCPCGTAFDCPPSSLKKYCSAKCRKDHSPGSATVCCKSCGAPIGEKRNTHRQFCSNKCRATAMKRPAVPGSYMRWYEKRREEKYLASLEAVTRP